MAFDFRGSLATREGFIAAIEEAGRYIADHAESLLGDYPSGLNELTVTAVFDFASPPHIDVKRRHFVLPPDKYPAQAANAAHCAETRRSRVSAGNALRGTGARKKQ